MMKRMLRSGLCMCALVSPAFAGLVKNGGFESGPAVSTYLTLNNGDTSITDWTVVGTSIDYIGPQLWGGKDSSRSLDLAGTPGPGGVEQTIATVAGVTYVVSFDMAGNPDGLAKQMTVEAVGVDSGQFVFDTAGHSTTAMGWEHMTWSFTAEGTTLLRFSTTNDTNSGPALDNVDVVAAVPAPAALLLGGLGVGLVGWLRRRRAV